MEESDLAVAARQITAMKLYGISFAFSQVGLLKKWRKRTN